MTEKSMPASLVQNICFIDLVYLDNIMLKMLMSHPKGNLIQMITSFI